MLWRKKKQSTAKTLSKADVTDAQPRTAGYQSWPTSLLTASFEQRPLFSLYQSDLMAVDHQVAFGEAISNGPLMNAKVTVKGPNKIVNEFVAAQWQRIWSTSARVILKGKRYGWIAGEIMYKRTAVGIEFDRLLDRHPRDTRPLIWNGRMVGLAVHNLQRRNDINAGAVKLPAHKAFWFTYGAEFGGRYGRPLYEKAYDPWYEKRAQGGAIPLRKLRMMKDAWIGDVYRVPFQRSLVREDGTEYSLQDGARELQDLRMTGGALCLPSDRDPEGNYLVDYQPPTNVSGATQIMEWVHDLDWDIWDAFYVPREVIEAAETGSGYSGRQLPFEAFLTVRDQEFSEIIQQAKPQLLERLVAMRFGVKASKEFDVTPESLVEEFRKSANEGGDKSSPKTPEPAQQIPGQRSQQQGNGVTQFSVAHSPAGGVTIDGKRFPGGEFIPGHTQAEVDAAARGGKGKSKPTEDQPSRKIKPTKQRAFSGHVSPLKNPISKQAAGKIGEEIIVAFLKAKGMKDARPMNLDRNNFPIDLIQDHETIEVKTGQSGNSSAAQQWRLTIGEPGKKEKEWLANASPEDKAKWNAKKQQAIHKRKAQILNSLGKELGHEIKAATMTVILNPDTKTADIYKFSGFHDRIGWNSDLAKSSYVASVKYA